MGERFEQHRDAEVPASPAEVWAAIATGPGIDSWFMGHSEVEPGAGGTVRTVFGGYAPELDITTWDPPRRFGYRSGEAGDGRSIAYEFLVEGRGGGSTVLRAVTSGFIPGDDWADEYEAMTAGGDGYFRTLVEYLAHFSGQYAVPVTAFGPGGRPDAGWARDRAALSAALGLPDVAAPGDVARFTPAEAERPVGGVVYHATPSAIAVRTPDAFYRFLRGFGHPMVAAHQLFSGEADPGRATRAWESWLARVLDQTSLPEGRSP
jgi:uncharacterized protein YndB with AHSA1/START domain